MAKSLQTRPVSKAQIRSYLAKSVEFFDAASAELEAGRPIAATSLAIHAAINAADVVCGAVIGERSAGQDHQQALVLLQRCGPAGGDLARSLTRLLPLKSRAEYEPHGVTLTQADICIKRAASCRLIAEQVAKDHL